MPFNGFPAGKTQLTPVPASFFSELMPEIQHLGELKLILYFFWRLDRMAGSFRFLRREDIVLDERLMASFGESQSSAEKVLDEALQRSVADQVLLQVELALDNRSDVLYFLNTPKGRAAVQAIQSGKWRPHASESDVIELADEPRNIFKLYEENIGPLTPLIAEALGKLKTPTHRPGSKKHSA